MKKMLRAACALVTCVGLSCTVCAADSSLFDRIYEHVKENAPSAEASSKDAGDDLSAAFDAFTKDAVSYAEEKGVSVKPVEKRKAVKFSDAKIEQMFRRWFKRDMGDVFVDELADITVAIVLGGDLYLNAFADCDSTERYDVYKDYPSTKEVKINLEALCDVLALCPNLHVLRISYCGLTDITPLESLFLTNLYLDYNDIESLDPIAHMTDLTYLKAEFNEITDLDALADMENLQYCFVMNNSVSDISGLAGKSKLTNLRLSFNPVGDLSPLADAVKLKTFEAQECGVSDVSVFEELENLEFVHMTHNSITDISPFGNSPKIRTLQLGYNQIDDISVIADLPRLTAVHMPSNNISDLSPIADNENIKSVWLGFNDISDLSPLAGCDHVDNLQVNGNQISDVSPVEDMGGLTRVNLSGNPVKDWTPVMGLDIDVTGIPENWTPPKEPGK